MSGPATTTTTVSGQRASIITRREGRARLQLWGASWFTHVIILCLAGLIWWIALGMVSATRTLTDAASFDIKLDATLAREGKWALLPATPSKLSINARGPVKELQAFESALAAGRGGDQSYALTITPADLERLTTDNLYRVTLAVPLSRFTSQLKGPPGVTLEPANPQLTVLIPLEEILVRTPVINYSRVENGPAGYEVGREIQPDFELEVVAPASRMREIVNDEGKPEVRLARVDINELLRTKELAGANRDKLLAEGFVHNADLVPIEGARIQRKGTLVETTQAPLRLRFSARSDFVDVEIELPVDIVFAPWMVEKGVRVMNASQRQKVQMQVLRGQATDATAANVQLRLDLSRIKLEDVKMEADPAPNEKRGKIFNVFLSLEIDSKKLTFKFKNPNVTAKQFLQLDEGVQLAWTAQ